MRNQTSSIPEYLFNIVDQPYILSFHVPLNQYDILFYFSYLAILSSFYLTDVNSPMPPKWADNILLVGLKHVHWFLICQYKIRNFVRPKSIVMWTGRVTAVCVSHRGVRLNRHGCDRNIWMADPTECFHFCLHGKCWHQQTFPHYDHSQYLQTKVCWAAYSVCAQGIGWTWWGMWDVHNWLTVYSSHLCKLDKHSVQTAGYLLLQLWYIVCALQNMPWRNTEYKLASVDFANTINYF